MPVCEDRLQIPARIGSGMRRNHARDVIVHDVCKQEQKEDEADLDDALFNHQADVPPQRPFDREQQDLAAIQNGNREQVEDAQIDTDESHEQDDLRRAATDGFARNLSDPDHALQLLYRGFAAEEPANDAHGLREEVAGLSQSKFAGLSERGPFVINLILIDDADLPVGFFDFFGRDRDGKLLVFALHQQRNGLAVGLADSVHKLAPVGDRATVGFQNPIVRFQAGALGGSAGSNFIDHRRKRGESDQLVESV